MLFEIMSWYQENSSWYVKLMLKNLNSIVSRVKVEKKQSYIYNLFAVEVTEAQSTTNMDSDATISHSDSNSEEEDSDQGFY